MTLVATLFADTFPIVIADSLISTNMPSSSPTPLVPRETRPGKAGYWPTGIARKIWVGETGAVFLYSGVIDHAQLIREQFDYAVQEHNGYNDDLHRRLCKHAEDGGAEVSFIVLDPTPEGEIGHYYKGADVDDIPNYGKVIAIGSGKKDLLGIMKRKPGQPVPPLDHDPSPEVLREHIRSCIRQAMHIAACLTENYVRKDSSMASASCGGYFEVLHPVSVFKDARLELLKRVVGTGYAHIFINFTSSDPCVEKVVLSNADDEKNTTLFTQDKMTIPVVGNEISVPRQTFMQMEIQSLHGDTLCTTISEALTFEYISNLTVYAYKTCPNCTGTASTHRIQSAMHKPQLTVKREGDELRIAFVRSEDNPFKGLTERMAAVRCPCAG